jgi:hypothetical protein
MVAVSGQPPEIRRGVQVTGAVLSALAAALLAFGAASPSWWSAERGAVEQRVGLNRLELCSGDSCQSRDLEGLGGPSGAWPALGSLGLALGAAAALVLALAAVAALALRDTRWPAWLGRLAAAIALIALVVGAGFAWTYPGFAGLTVGSGMIAYLVGGALGVGAAGVLIAGGGARPAS